MAVSGLRPFGEVLREVGEASYVRVSGQWIHLQDHGAGDPLILLHGFGASAYSWRLVQPRLARDLRTVALDLNGFGYTERPRDPESYSRTGQLRLILSVMDALGITSAHFAGHSYGGALSLTLAHQHPDRVRSLILVDSAAPVFPTLRRPGLALLAPLAPVLLQAIARSRTCSRWIFRHNYHDPSLITDELVKDYLERLQVEGTTRAFRHLGAGRRPREDGEQVALAEIRQPALLIWGSEDRLVPVAMGRAAAGKLPDARFEEIPDCGHAPMEERPEVFLALVGDFLAGIRPGP